MSRKDILIVEDDKSILRILSLELGNEGYSYHTAMDGQDALRKFHDNDYNLIILDLMLPHISGIEVCRKIRKTSEIPIIMLTAKRDVMDRVIGLDMGADDYITKPFEIEELLARIRATMRRQQINMDRSNHIELGDLKIDLLRRKVKMKDDTILLTKTEYELLEYLVSNKGNVLTRQQIIKKVWGYDYMGDTNILDVYIKYLRNKLDYTYDIQLIKTIRGVGYTAKVPAVSQ